MSARFIIGRAGCGKTFRCLSAIRERVRMDPLDGPALVFLVPEQAALQMERTILAPNFPASTAPSNPHGAFPAAHRVEVLSFRRLAYRILDALNVSHRQPLSEAARAMVIQHLLKRRTSELQYYRRVERLGGTPERLGNTIAELMEELITPDELFAAPADSKSTDPAHRAKLHDLRIIYTDYLRYLGDTHLDPAQFLSIARDHLPRFRRLHGAEVWVDGFASFSALERETLTAIAQLAAHMEITAMFDPSLAEIPPGRPYADAETRLFHRTHQTYWELRHAVEQQGIPLAPPILLDQTPMLRFARNRSLSKLEASLFERAEGENATPTTPVEEPGDPSSVRLLALPSRRLEVEYAVDCVCEWIADPGRDYRYRDIAIITRDLTPYHDLLSQALHARRIPFFIDRRRLIAHHPVIELLRSAVALASEDLSIDSVRLALKTGLWPLSFEESDELENYILAHGLSGQQIWTANDWTFRPRSNFIAEDEPLRPDETAMLLRVNLARKSFLSPLGPWLEFASTEPTPRGPSWVRAFMELFNRLQIIQTLNRWTTEADDSGHLDEAAEHRQIYPDIIDFLVALSDAFADRPLTLDDLAGVLESGLSTLSLGLAPPMVDQVLVGSIDRSRHPDIKAAVLIGFNEGIFPSMLAEDSILNDDDRELLIAGGLPLRTALKDGIWNERLLFYTAVTRAADALVITYATADEQSRSLAPSPYVSALKAACPGLVVHTAQEVHQDQTRNPIWTQRDLVSRLAVAFRSRVNSPNGGETARDPWSGLYERARPMLTKDPFARRVFSAFAESSNLRLTGPTLDALYPTTLRSSVSELETAAACPFQHFAKYTLKLRERAVSTVAPVDVGQWHHAILEDFFKKAAEKGREWTALSDADLLSELDQSRIHVAETLPEDGTLSTARDAYLIRRSAEHLSRIVQTQRNAARRGKAIPRAVELPFGFDDQPGSLPTLRLHTPNGRLIHLRGYIDRVDLAELGDELLGIVVDYKWTPNKRLDLSRAYHGLSLQLLAYLLVLAECGKTLAGRPIRPIAGLYVSLTPTYQLVPHPSLASDEMAASQGVFRPRGLIRSEDMTSLDTELGEGKRSEIYAIAQKKDGGLSDVDRSDGADSNAFNALLTHTKHTLGRLADGILDGDVSVNPYRLGTFSPCSWCPMKSVCRFDMGLFDIRFLDPLKRSEVFAKLAGKNDDQS
ncbi:MAG: PD-(D/E)XK nuclease family protein [Planctomycetota bacterium]